MCYNIDINNINSLYMPSLSHSAYRILIFVVGIIATISYRLVIVLNHYSAFWLEVSWYIGTIGFIWYFGHRWRVETKREQLIKHLDLIGKIEAGQTINLEEKNALIYILKGLRTSLARWNYIIIFVSSFLAIVYAVAADLLKLY